MQRIVNHYLTAWRMDRVMLIGYSLGADVLPFMANRLPAELMKRTSLIALLGAGHDVNFEFHFSEWLPGVKDGAYKVKPEVEKLAGNNLLCIYGEDDSASLCPDMDPTQFKIAELPGGHHFGNDYMALADLILREVR